MQPNKPEGSLDEIQQAIRSWLIARHQMMIAFNDLCLLKPFDERNKHEIQLALENFCNELIDYLSFGQFKIFDHLVKMMQPSSQDGRLVKILLSKIFSSTVQSIEFHDLYMQSFSFKNLEADLSSLGEQLAHRLDWEDQLLDLVYKYIHAATPAKPKKMG